jgi:CheY-like chemotaxis protein
LRNGFAGGYQCGIVISSISEDGAMETNRRRDPERRPKGAFRRHNLGYCQGEETAGWQVAGLRQRGAPMPAPPNLIALSSAPSDQFGLDVNCMKDALAVARPIQPYDELLEMPHILVVDDERMICELVAEVLQRVGFEVWSAENGDRAFDLVEANTHVGLVILDWRLPDASGHRVLDRLVAIRPRMRAIVTSGDHVSDVRSAFSGRKIDAFLTKPFNVETLVTEVKSALAA